MKYCGALLVVKDLEKSKQFYKDILDCEVTLDFGANVTLTGGFCLQTAESWQGFIQKAEEDIVYGGNNAELFFEEDDMDGFIAKLNGLDVDYVHPVEEQRWGQRTVAIYDPDMHIIEVGENMAVVAKRFIDSGMTTLQAAVRMDVPAEYVQSLLSQVTL